MYRIMFDFLINTFYLKNERVKPEIRKQQKKLNKSWKFWALIVIVGTILNHLWRKKCLSFLGKRDCRKWVTCSSFYKIWSRKRDILALVRKTWPSANRNGRQIETVVRELRWSCNRDIIIFVISIFRHFFCRKNTIFDPNIMLWKSFVDMLIS